MKKLAEGQNNSRKDAKPQRVAKQTKEFPIAPLRLGALACNVFEFFHTFRCPCYVEKSDHPKSNSHLEGS
jgi:hypothetical protein